MYGAAWGRTARSYAAFMMVRSLHIQSTNHYEPADTDRTDGSKD